MRTPEIEAALAWADEQGPYTPVFNQKNASILAAALRQAEAKLSCVDESAKLRLARAEKAEAELAKFPDHRCPSCGYPEEPGADFPGWVGMKKERDLALAQLGDAREKLGDLVHKFRINHSRHTFQVGGNKIEGLWYPVKEVEAFLDSLSRTPANDSQESK